MSRETLHGSSIFPRCSRGPLSGASRHGRCTPADTMKKLQVLPQGSALGRLGENWVENYIENSVGNQINLRYNHDENWIEIEKFREVAAFFFSDASVWRSALKRPRMLGRRVNNEKERGRGEGMERFSAFSRKSEKIGFKIQANLNFR